MRKSENKSKRKANRFAVILGIIWGILVVVLFFSVRKIFTYNNSNYVQDPEYIINNVVSGNYGTIYYRVQNIIEGGATVEEYPEYSELMAVHDYMEAAANVRIYEKNGIAEKVSLYKGRMEEARKNLGDLDFSAAEIDEVLGLTK